MSSKARKAPAGKFIVGEAEMSKGDWGQVGEPHNTREAAEKAAELLKAGAKSPEFDYFVYDERGLVSIAA